MKVAWKIAAVLVVALAAGIWALPLFRPAPPGLIDPAIWHRYAERFVTPEGRVIDPDNGGITHTEGLGYGMLLAAAAGDRANFGRIWQWTDSQMRRNDGLLSWEYGACASNPAGCVLDHNNASSGDILIAWALLRGGRQWHDERYLAAGQALVSAIERELVVHQGRRTLLLPGKEGFQGDTWVVVNPAYWLFPAFQAFADETHAPVWPALIQDGSSLLRDARFGAHHLPSDWVRVEGDSLRPADGQQPQFGFHAVRVPMNLVWMKQSPRDLLQPFADYWTAATANGQTPPAWIDVTSDAHADYPWQTGMAAIAQLTLAAARGTPVAADQLPLPRQDEGYFSWSLALLSRLAAVESVK